MGWVCAKVETEYTLHLKGSPQPFILSKSNEVCGKQVICLVSQVIVEMHWLASWVSGAHGLNISPSSDC